MYQTPLDIVVASTNQLNPHQFTELRKLWVHGVQLDTNAVGWLPTSVFDSRAATDEVTAVYRDNELVGWLLRGESTARRVVKIYQIWVRTDARILEHGRALIDHLTPIARRRNCGLFEAWVADDLPANLFWKAMQFSRGVWRWGRGRSLRKIYRWTRTVLPTLGEFANLHATQRGNSGKTEEWKGLEHYDPISERHTVYD